MTTPGVSAKNASGPSARAGGRLTLLPAVDVAGGQAVRLVQGAAGTETDYGAPLQAALAWQAAGAPVPLRAGFSLVWTAAAGLLVGFGTRMGTGCTSGHGVCGLGRLSARSLVAVITFMATGMVAAFVTRHLLGVAS